MDLGGPGVFMGTEGLSRMHETVDMQALEWG